MSLVRPSSRAPRRYAVLPWMATCGLLGIAGLVLSACSQSTAATKVRTEVVAQDLDHPWALAFIDGGRMLVTERPGRLRLVLPDGTLQPVDGLPKIHAAGQGGLLDLITDRDFARNRMIYFCFAEAGGPGSSTALASARLSDDSKRLEQVKVLFSQRPKVNSNAHFGCRIVENTDGTLFLTLGDRYGRMDDAQTLDNHHGKVVRVNKDGSVPQDNPFVGKAGALPEIWSYGHRNMQGATLGPDGKLWTNEHGAQGGDEVNRPEGGRNYGWPVISYGKHYGGKDVGDGQPSKPGMEQPVHYWTPSIAPSGMTFLRSDRFGKAWQGNLFVGSLKFQYLNRMELKDGKVVREEKLLENVDQRIRDVREGPDGLLYVVTDESHGQIIRILPAR
jgi:glucose/arabinose dehydrogenase